MLTIYSLDLTNIQGYGIDSYLQEQLTLPLRL